LSRASVPGSWVEFPASVKGAITGHLLPMPALGGDLEFHTGKFELASRAFDAPVSSGIDILHFAQSAGTFHFTFTDHGAGFEDIALTVGAEQKTRVRGTVRLNPFDMGHFIDIAANFDAVDLSDFESIAELPWAGQGTLRGTIRGAPGRVVVDAQTALRDFKLDGYSLGVAQSPIRFEGQTLSFPAVVAQKGQTQYFGDVALDFLDQGLHAHASVQLPDGRVEDVVDLLADLSPTMANLQDGALTGRLSALMAVDSPAKELAGVIAMKVQNGEYLQRRLGPADVVVRFDHGEALVLEPTAFDGPLGHFTAAGRWAFSGPLSFDLAIDDGSTAELMDPKGLDGTPVGGTFTVKTHVGGDTDTILADGWFASPDLLFRGRSLGPMHLEGRLVGREFSTFGTVFPGVKGTAKFSFRADWPFQTALQIDLDDLSPFLPASAGLTARAHGKLVASGPYRDWKQSKGTASLELLSIARGEVSATNTAPVELGYNAGAFEVRSLSMKGPTTEFEAEGSWGPSTVNLSSRGSVDLRLLSSFLSAVERTQGRLDFTAAFSGPVKSPSLAGSAEVSDVRFTVKGQDLSVKSLTGRADFSESRVLISDVQGFANDGRLRMRGDVRLDKLAVKSVELQTDLEDVTVSVQETPATVSGSLMASSKVPGQWLLQGGLEVQKFRYTQQMALDSLLANARKGVPSDARPEEWLKLDVDLTAGSDVRIDNNLARARLLGKLKVSGTNVKPVLIGAIELGDGAQAFFRGNTFQITRGQLQFNGLWPTFDLSAQSQVRDYLVSVKAFGRIEDPKISLSSEPALADTDVLSLLTLGVTSRERLTGQGGASLAAEALMTASGLDQTVQKFMSQVGLKDQQIKMTTTFNEVTGSAEPSVSLEGKVLGTVLNDKLKLGITQPVTGKGTRAQLEYQLDQHLSGRIQWDNQNQNTPFGNPGAELRLRFEWE
jgi:translocation and assembly module TamB